MDGRTDRWIDGGLDGRCMDGWTGRWRWMDRRMDEWMDRWMNHSTEGWKGGRRGPGQEASAQQHPSLLNYSKGRRFKATSLAGGWAAYSRR